MSFDDKKYLLDGIPKSARDLIKMASSYDPDYGKDGLKQTSIAATILRENGFTVEDK